MGETEAGEKMKGGKREEIRGRGGRGEPDEMRRGH